MKSRDVSSAPLIRPKLSGLCRGESRHSKKNCPILKYSRMKHGFFKIGLLALFLSAPSLHAQHWGVGALSGPADRCNFSSERSGQRFIFADFNNDQKPDSLTLRSLGQHGGQNVFGVRVCDSGRIVSLLTFESSEPSITVTAIDVNQDGSPDIVVEQRYTQKRIQVWLNDGHGGFRKARAADFPNLGTRAPCRVAAPSEGRHNLPPRAHLWRGKKLCIQRAELPTTSRSSPSRYHRSPTVRVQRTWADPTSAVLRPSHSISKTSPYGQA